ncbi:unnamed protein product [Rotaria sp. Silwood1]|nr:unnamed protein product [Rotaria sp. Silwood1]
MVTNLYQWGIIYDSQSQKRIKCHIPTKTTINQRLEGNLEQVTCDTNFTVVLDSNHCVYVVGDESKYGRLGQGDDKTIVPTLTLIKGRLPPIGFISSGPSTTILLTTDKRELWGFGKGIGYLPKQILQKRRFNRDGFTTEWISVYQLSDDNDKIQHIDICSFVNGFIIEQGHIYLWGSTVPYGKISDQENFRNITINNPIRKDLINNNNNNDRPIKISLSRGQFHAHILLLTEQGCIYLMGSNYKAKLGIDIDHIFTGEWTLIELTRTSPFKMIAAGGIHSSALSTDGRVFTWGCGSDGRLGHAEVQDHRYLYKEHESRSIDLLNNQQVLSISTSYYHMAAIVVQ